MNYDEHMDFECIPLCDAFNSALKVETKFSCFGHYKYPFHIVFACNQSKHLLPLMQLLDSKKYKNKFMITVIRSFNFIDFEILYKFETIDIITKSLHKLITQLSEDILNLKK